MTTAGSSFATFATDHFALRRGLLQPGLVDVVRLYVAQALAEKRLAFGDSQSDRWRTSDDPLSDAVQRAVLDEVQQTVGRRLVPTYSMIVVYDQGARLDRHHDRESSELVVSVAIDTRLEGRRCEPWPLGIGTPEGDVTFGLEPGDALIFRGHEVEHFRDPLGPGRRSTSLLLFYVEQEGAFRRHSERSDSVGFADGPAVAQVGLPQIGDTTAASEASAWLHRTGFTCRGLQERLGLSQEQLELRPELVGRLHLLAEEPSLCALVELFLLDRVLTEEDANVSLGSGVQVLTQAGLLERAGGRVTPAFDLRPFGDVLVVADRASSGAGRALAPDAWALTVSHLTPRRNAESALHLRAGVGAQALLTARHCKQVVAVDENPRARDLIQFNAGLNGLTNIRVTPEVPAQHLGEGSDVVVVDQPVLVTLRVGEAELSDADEPSRAVVRDIASQLAEGGLGHALCQWCETPGDDGLGRVRSWLDETSCDALILRSSSQDIGSFAVAPDITPAAIPSVRAWLAGCREQGVEAIGAGVVLLRRRSHGKNWTRAMEMRSMPMTAAGEQLERVWSGLDFLDEVPTNKQLLECAYGLAEEHALDQSLNFQGGNYQFAPLEMRSPFDEIEFVVQIPPELAPLLLRLDARPLSEVVAEVSAETGSDYEHLAGLAATGTRELVARGLMTPR